MKLFGNHNKDYESISCTA